MSELDKYPPRPAGHPGHSDPKTFLSILMCAQCGMVREDDIKGRAVVVAIIATVFVVQYLASTQYDEVTGESHHFAYSVEKEIELGRTAAPKLMAQHGGEATGRASDLVRSLGKKLVRTSIASKSKYSFEFHVLNDDATINAFVSNVG